MSLNEFLKSKTFLKQIGIALGFAVLIVIFTLQILKLYTYHGKSKELPNFTAWSIDSAITYCIDNDLKYQIIDSVFVKDQAPETIVAQSPDSGFSVKKHRTIYFTINEKEAELLPMPNLMDLSLRQAKSTLEHRGFFLGEIDYQPDIALGIVLRQKVNGLETSAGQLVTKGSYIDLTIGSGLSDESVPVPSLIGLTHQQATELVKTSFLRIGVVLYDEEFILYASDTLAAFIYQQSPAAFDQAIIPLGSTIDIWLTTDSSKINSHTINQENFDSIDESNI
jgi:eukaryotic-like serine/threonine-protein kinase